MKVWRETAVGAAIVDKVYPVTPSTITVKTGMITGEVIELKVTERVDKGSGRVVSPARLTQASWVCSAPPDLYINVPLSDTVKLIDVENRPTPSATATASPCRESVARSNRCARSVDWRKNST